MHVHGLQFAKVSTNNPGNAVLPIFLPAKFLTIW